MTNLQERFLSYLCPPGNGVFTVHTGRQRREKLHEALYGTHDPGEVQSSWENSIRQFPAKDSPCLIGATSDTGGGILRGCNWGPLYLRQSWPEYFSQYQDMGDIRTIPHLLHDKYLNEKTLASCRKALYQDERSPLPVSPLSILEDFSKSFFAQTNRSLMTLGGDHSISYPCVSEWIKSRREKGKKVAIIHFDAHTDLLPSRLGVDICFASWAYHCSKLLQSPNHLIQLGIRSSGFPKTYWEKKLGIKQFWANELQESWEKITDRIIHDLEKDGVQELYLSFDIDALDGQYASSTGTPEPNGLSPNLCLFIMKKLASSFSFHSADLVEVSPFLHTELSQSKEPETTLENAKLIFQFIISTLNNRE